MVIESDQFNQICVVVFVALQIFTNDFSEAVDNKFLLEFWIEFLSVTELFIGFIFVFESLEIEESE